MNTRYRDWRIRSGRIVLAVVAVALMTAPSFAATFNLRADMTTLSMPDGAAVPAWGFACDSAVAPATCPNPGAVTVPGPMLTIPPGDGTLAINLTNNLPVPVSLVIPGQPAVLAPVTFLDGEGRTRVASFTAEAAPGGGTQTYAWNNLKPGTYLYHSGTNPGRQVPMGLYGGIKQDVAAGTAYPGIPYDAEVVLFYSEIDPVLAAAAATAQPLSYKPAYFLVNGQPYSPARPDLPAAGAGQRTLIRLLNGGIQSHVPALTGSYWSVVAEDGNPYAYPKEQYSVLLPAGKTKDILWTPDAPGRYPVHDRSHQLTSAGATGGGMLAYLSVGGTGVPPSAVDDVYSVNQDTALAVPAPGVLGNDAGSGLSAALSSYTGTGALSVAADGSFNYTPAAGFTGPDSFTYTASNAFGSSTATVTVTVNAVTNAAPVAHAGSASTDEDTAVVVTLTATDADGDPLTYAVVAGPANGSLSGVLPNLTYTPSANYNGSDSFTFKANDGIADSNVATVSITVNPVNDAPVAVNDFATTQKNTAKILNLIVNDYDPDDPAGTFGGNPGSTINPATVAVPAASTRGGTVVNHGNGTVTYTPRNNFRGTDTFTYTVKDAPGATSNAATVQINVVK